MRRLALIPPIVAALLLTACINTWDIGGGSLPAQSVVPFETIPNGPGFALSDFDRPEMYVIRDSESWAEYWPDSLPYPRPAVDFKRDIVIAIAESHYTGGFDLTIDQIVVDGLTLRVDTTTDVPTGYVTMALTTNLQVIKLQRYDLPATLTNRRCPSITCLPAVP